jgi:hypothetical protein
MWEKLLANASVSFEQRYLGYVELLKGMSGDEARLLNELCRHGDVEVYYDIHKEWIDHIVGDTETLLAGLEIEWLPSAGATFTHPKNLDLVFEHDWKEARLITLFEYPQAHRRSDGTLQTPTGTYYHYRPGTTEDIFVHKNLVRKGLAYEATVRAKVNFLDQEYTVSVWFLQATEIGIDFVRTCTGLTKKK